MTKDIAYADKRIDDIIRAKHFIPYRVNKSVKYKNGASYYSDYWREFFKVISVKYNKYGILENAYIKWDDGNYGLICTDLDSADYLIEKDNMDIYKDQIINTNRSYTGAEIVYWFFYNNIGQMTKKYSGFWKFVDRYSTLRIIDNNRYYLSANLSEDDIYINCKVKKAKNPSRN